MPFEILVAIILLVVLNLRGIKESVTFLAPIFIIFVADPLFMIGYGVFSHLPQIGAVVHGRSAADFKTGLATLGAGGMLLPVFAGLLHGRRDLYRDRGRFQRPADHAGAAGPQRQKDDGLPGTSLAVTAGGILSAIFSSTFMPSPGRTLNAVLADDALRRLELRAALALITIFSEGALLLVGAQAGFIDGPRVMANMAVDYWFPHRFASLSDRFTIQNGVLLMGGAAILLLLYARGNITTLVVMYSINVFLTFSLSEFGMSQVLHQEPAKRERTGKNTCPST